MSAASHFEAEPLPTVAETLAQRRERLALLCALDRARLRLAVLPPKRAPSAAKAGALNLLLDLARWLPGRPGTWARRASFASDLFRLFVR